MTTQNNKDNSKLIEKIREKTIDGVKITAVSGALTLLDLTRSCSKLPEKIGISIDPSGVQTALMAFDVGAGAFAGYTNKYGTSLAIYGATLLPEVYNVCAGGDLAEAGKMALAKTIMYGGAYALGYIIGWEKKNRD
jgi:hypothetical protein